MRYSLNTNQILTHRDMWTLFPASTINKSARSHTDTNTACRYKILNHKVVQIIYKSLPEHGLQSDQRVVRHTPRPSPCSLTVASDFAKFSELSSSSPAHSAIGATHISLKINCRLQPFACAC